MKNAVFLLFLFIQISCADGQKPATTQGGTSTPVAQTQSADPDYKATNEGWLVDLDEAYNLSKKTGKPIMANFTGSDWCGWCKRLTASVFSKPEFKTWSDKNVVLLELDFPRRFQIPQKYQQQNQNLQQAFKVTGYPTVWVFNMEKDDKGNYSIQAIGKTGYTATVDEFTNNVGQMIQSAAK